MEPIFVNFGNDKESNYKQFISQLQAFMGDETNEVSNMANIAAALHDIFKFFWVGFYRVIDGELVLGPFQGTPAVSRIEKGKGVCGTAWEQEITVIVPDVNKFPGHIACSLQSKSEIVVPLKKGNEVKAVLDIDSTKLDEFDETDGKYLEEIMDILSKQIFK